jgi:hypothetical protein
MKSLVWSIAALFSSLGVTTLAVSGYCYEEHLCIGYDISTINMVAVIFFILSTSILFSIIMYTLYTGKNRYLL